MAARKTRKNNKPEDLMFSREEFIFNLIAGPDYFDWKSAFEGREGKVILKERKSRNKIYKIETLNKQANIFAPDNYRKTIEYYLSEIKNKKFSIDENSENLPRLRKSLTDFFQDGMGRLTSYMELLILNSAQVIQSEYSPMPIYNEHTRQLFLHHYIKKYLGDKREYSTKINELRENIFKHKESNQKISRNMQGYIVSPRAVSGEGFYGALWGIKGLPSIVNKIADSIITSYRFFQKKRPERLKNIKKRFKFENNDKYSPDLFSLIDDLDVVRDSLRCTVIKKQRNETSQRFDSNLMFSTIDSLEEDVEKIEHNCPYNKKTRISGSISGTSNGNGSSSLNHERAYFRIGNTFLEDQIMFFDGVLKKLHGTPDADVHYHRKESTDYKTEELSIIYALKPEIEKALSGVEIPTLCTRPLERYKQITENTLNNMQKALFEYYNPSSTQSGQTGLDITLNTNQEISNYLNDNLIDKVTKAGYSFWKSVKDQYDFFLGFQNKVYNIAEITNDDQTVLLKNSKTTPKKMPKKQRDALSVIRKKQTPYTKHLFEELVSMLEVKVSEIGEMPIDNRFQEEVQDETIHLDDKVFLNEYYDIIVKTEGIVKQIFCAEKNEIRDPFFKDNDLKDRLKKLSSKASTLKNQFDLYNKTVEVYNVLQSTRKDNEIISHEHYTKALNTLSKFGTKKLENHDEMRFINVSYGMKVACSLLTSAANLKIDYAGDDLRETLSKLMKPKGVIDQTFMNFAGKFTFAQDQLSPKSKYDFAKISDCYRELYTQVKVKFDLDFSKNN